MTTQTKPAQNDSQQPGQAVKERESAQIEQPTNSNPVEQKKPRQGILKFVRIIGAVALLAGIGFAIYRLFFYHPDAEGLFLSGRVAQVAVREGDTVKPAQLLVQIDDSDLRAQLQGAVARVRAAQERLQLPVSSCPSCRRNFSKLA